jgi:hypothetical protein
MANENILGMVEEREADGKAGEEKYGAGHAGNYRTKVLYRQA